MLAKIKSMQRVVFINRFYAPDHSATSQILTDLAEHLASLGGDIHIVSSRQLYEDAKARLQSFELINDVSIHRVYTTKFGRKNIIGRTVDYASFYIFSFFFLLKFIKAKDTVVAKTDPPLISVVAAFVAKVKKAKLINWVQDLFPEVAIAINPGAIPLPFISLIQKMRNWSFVAASKNVVIGELMREKLKNNGIDESKIEVIHNWFVDENNYPTGEEINKLKLKWGLEGKYIVGYSGNLGRAHEYHTFLKAIELLKEIQEIVFLFIGGGVGMEALKKITCKKKLTNIVYMPYQDKSKLNLTLRVPDIHLISLLPSLEGLIVPSKFYGIFAVGRPVIFVGSKDGELAKILNDTHCGINIPNLDSNFLADEILKYYSGKNNNMNVSGASKNKFLFKNASMKWLSLLVE